MKPRRLKGHKAAATCCIASRDRPGIIASSGEDGCICWFDLRCKDVIFTIEVGKEPISSLCFKGGNEDVIYVSSGAEISCFGVHMGTGKPLETYNYNKDEINQIAFSSKLGFLAAADDSGDVKIVDTNQKSLYKSLRTAHTTRSAAPYNLFPGNLGQVYLAAITGGLDSTLAMWDFSKGRRLCIIDYGMPELGNSASSSNVGQCFNPAFVHSIAIPEVDMLGGSYRVCAVARGDGVVDVIDLESVLAPQKPKSSHQSTGSQLRSKKNDVRATNSHMTDQSQQKMMHLDYTLAGHTAAVSCVSFSAFGERGKFLISGGNDASVKLWDWSNQFSSLETSCNGVLALNIDVNKKVNWLCTSSSDSENLIVCDTSKALKVYSI